MKKLAIAITVLATLTACSSPESRRLANDSYAKHAADTTEFTTLDTCLLYTSPSPRDLSTARMPSSA